MQKIIPYYKPIGWTPLMAIEQLKKGRPELRDISVTYAGRLDPMAEGLLLLLVGDEVHNKEHYQDLDKVYEAQVLFGFETDSYDLLGLPVYHAEQISEPKISTAINQLLGKHTLPYPPFSSKTVDGQPLWKLTRSSQTPDEIPSRVMEVRDLELGDVNQMAWEDIYQEITRKIKLIKGDFRQEQILEAWSKFNGQIDPKDTFFVANLTLTVSSGTYIRTLANLLGQNLKTGACLFALNRTQIGDYKTPPIE